MIKLSERAQQFCDTVLSTLIEQNIASKISEKDHQLWGPEASAEAKIRLNWLDAPANVAAILEQVSSTIAELSDISDPKVVLCGMGGSSLGPEVIARAEGLNFVALDATDPAQVARELDSLENVIVVNSSKSGSTVETDSHRRVFEEAFIQAGIDTLDRIIFVTDPGSPLSEDVRSKGYRHVFHADPNIGGRFSVLTAFGIVPTAILGADITSLGEDAAELLQQLIVDDETNPAIQLAAAIASHVQQVNKILIVEDPDHAIGLGDWIEQLIAESTGKEGTGILPVIVTPSAYELRAELSDTLTVWLGSESAAKAHGVSADIVCDYSLGEQFILWEYATAIMGYLLEIDPFNQPDVEAAKIAARELLDAPAHEEDTDEAPLANSSGEAIKLHAQENIENTNSIADALEKLFELVEDNSYISIQTYLDRPGFPGFTDLRDVVAQLTGRPTTFGWGPRFLHSTGQFHKGGPKQGIFLQLIHTGADDLAIPGREFSFQELLLAQADGDRRVLAELGRPVLSLAISEPASALNELKHLLKGQ